MRRGNTLDKMRLDGLEEMIKLSEMDLNYLIHSVRDARAIGYVVVASATIMVYEWSILLEQEVSLIWYSPWSLVKVLYFLSRYSQILDIGVHFQEHIQTSADPKICYISHDIATVSSGLGIAVSELILIVRTCALYGNSKRIIYGLGLVWTIWVFGNSWPIVKFMKSSVFEHQVSALIPGCYLTKASPLILICFVSLLLLETLMVVMTVWKAFKLFRGSTNLLISRFFRDGIIYYICLFALTLANVLVILLAPNDMLDLLDTLLRVSHSTLCCRLLLGLRETAAIAEISSQRGDMVTTLPVSGQMEFGTPVVNAEGEMSMLEP
ncbi:hypothetical protein EDD85DRAFT_825785 [Armillaria nabsnona]|nr:hypothetical protein EDD85DRAFT_825785 [Armillaria nabsnona]